MESRRYMQGDPGKTLNNYMSFPPQWIMENTQKYGEQMEVKDIEIAD